MNIGYSILGVVSILFVAVLGLGVSWGQFRKGVVQELRDALDSARTEIEIGRSRAERLEVEVTWMKQRIMELESRPDWTQVVAVIGVTEKNIVHAITQMQAEARLQHEVALREIAAQVAERTRIHLGAKPTD